MLHVTPVNGVDCILYKDTALNVCMCFAGPPCHIDPWRKHKLIRVFLGMQATCTGEQRFTPLQTCVPRIIFVCVLAPRRGTYMIHVIYSELCATYG